MQIKRIIILVLDVTSLTTYAQKVQRAVIIGLDGFSVSGFKTARHPNIDALFASGVLSLSTCPVMPSVTLPN